MTINTTARRSGTTAKRGPRTQVSKAIINAAWISFLAEVAIIGTGGAVRLTGSGLGCPTWPTCTPESLIPTAELGYHSAIEFGNRMMTGVLGLAALAVVILLWRIRRQRNDLWILSLIALGGVVAQAIVGGITVLTGLNPIIVGFHYIASVLLVCITAAFIVRMRELPGVRVRAVPKPFLALTHATSFVLLVTIVFGVVTTGAGPYSGDANVERNGLDATLWQHIHSWPGYALALLSLVLVVFSFVQKLSTRLWAGLLLLGVAVQITVGVFQATRGLPGLSVGIHMVLGGLIAAAMTVLILKLKRNSDANVGFEKL